MAQMANYFRSTGNVEAEEFEGHRHWLALLFLRRLHVEAEEFERRIAIDPAVPRMRLEQNTSSGL
jgi:hypothetical protein